MRLRSLVAAGLGVAFAWSASASPASHTAWAEDGKKGGKDGKKKKGGKGGKDGKLPEKDKRPTV